MESHLSFETALGNKNTLGPHFIGKSEIECQGLLLKDCKVSEGIHAYPTTWQ